MCPWIILNGKCNNKAARKLPCSRTIWYLQIDLGCKRILWGRMSSLFFLILYSLKGENTCTFYMLQGTLKVLLSTFLSLLPDCSHCWSAWHWGQKSNVPWSRVTIIAVSLWAGSLPKVLIQVIGEELSRGCNGRRLQIWSPQNHFHLLWRILREGFHSTVLFLWGALILQRKWSKTLQFLPKWPIERMIDNCIIFITIFSKEK